MPFQLDVLPVTIDEDGTYALGRSLPYWGKQDRIVVPEGYRTDLASVPRIMRALVDVAGRHNRAAILHDWLCTLQRRAYASGKSPRIDSVDTDGLFRRCLRELGVSRGRRTLYWLGVRWGAAWQPHRRAGWWRTAHVVLPLSLLLLPFLLPLAAVTAITSAVLHLAGLFLALVPDRAPAGGRSARPPAGDPR
jgi:hypothetical protein